MSPIARLKALNWSKGHLGSVLTENRLAVLVLTVVPDLAIEGDGSVAVVLNLAAGRETPDDERFTETTDSNGLALAGKPIRRCLRTGGRGIISNCFRNTS
jgi:hypothetical protein